MIAALVICFGYVVLVWLVFFKFKWLTFSIAWGVVSVFVGLHLLIIFLIGLRFVTPYSTDAKIIQHTIQLTPRLSEPTLVTAVLVAQNQGRAAIYTNPSSGFAILRRIGIRGYTWFNWLYPFSG
jgi:hypothetical protein